MDLYVGKGGMYMTSCGLPREYWDDLKTQARPMSWFGRAQSALLLQQRREKSGCAVGWPLLWAGWLDTNVQPEAEARDRKLEELLMLKKNMCLSTSLLPLGLQTR